RLGLWAVNRSGLSQGSPNMHVNHPESHRQPPDSWKLSRELGRATAPTCARCGSRRNECLLDAGDVTLHKCEECGWRFTRVAAAARALSVRLRARRAAEWPEATRS